MSLSGIAIQGQAQANKKRRALAEVFRLEAGKITWLAAGLFFSWLDEYLFWIWASCHNLGSRCF